MSKFPIMAMNPASAEALFTDLFGAEPYAFWLEGIGRKHSRTIIGTASGAGGQILTYNVGGPVELAYTGASVTERVDGPFFQVLRERLAVCSAWSDLTGADAFCGYFGYLGYELKSDLGSPSNHVSSLPDACLMFASELVVLDSRHTRSPAICLAFGDDGMPCEMRTENLRSRVEAVGSRHVPPDPSSVHE